MMLRLFSQPTYARHIAIAMTGLLFTTAITATETAKRASDSNTSSTHDYAQRVSLYQCAQLRDSLSAVAYIRNNWHREDSISYRTLAFALRWIDEASDGCAQLEQFLYTTPHACHKLARVVMASGFHVPEIIPCMLAFVGDTDTKQILTPLVMRHIGDDTHIGTSYIVTYSLPERHADIIDAAINNLNRLPLDKYVIIEPILRDNSDLCQRFIDAIDATSTVNEEIQNEVKDLREFATMHQNT